jgi:hypothetical protein
MHITKLTYDRIRSEYLKLKGSDFDRWYISLNSYEKNIFTKVFEDLQKEK